ncbi:MAG: PTS sugar transporter subunit IIA [Gemmataceae bacterium]|nr:PTS sugar transporter subunit IIA [Gemmataceae bacterium]MDW8241966.1 PTS sugar transporter subunit IIA [Thermogemmata sp.]
MRLTSFLVREAIIPELSVRGNGIDPKNPQQVLEVKTRVIREMAQALHAAGYFRADELDDIVKAVIRREQLGTTGIGQGIAIPHSRHSSVHELVGTLALAPEGLPFDSLDNEPVYVIFLLVSPQERPGDHLRALEAIVRTMRDADFVKRLRACKSREEIWNLLESAAPGW